MTAPEFTPAELATLWRFELADAAPESAAPNAGPLLTDEDVRRAADLAADTDAGVTP